MPPRVKNRLLFFLAGAWLSCLPAEAQSVLQKEISATFHQVTLVEILYTLEIQQGIKFYYLPDKLPVYRQSFEFQQIPLYSVLQDILKGSDLTFIQYDPQSVVLLPRLKRNKAYADELVRQWREGIITLPTSDEPLRLRYTAGDSTQMPPPGREYTLSGIVTDAAGSPVTGATIGRQGTPYGESTDEKGGYRLRLPAGYQQIEVQFIGYQPVQVNLGLFADGRLDLKLQVRALRLGEIVVEAQAIDHNVSSTQAGLEQLSVKTVRQLPSFLGEADVVKSLTLLAGVSTVGEGASGFNVRGGNIDQNLVIQDGAPLYNSSHALGFFSIFNADAIRNVTLHKGNIPAQYGGRTSSVLEIDLQDGNFDRIHGRGGIGLVSSRIMLEGPLSKGRTSFLAAGRLSYPGWLLREVDNPDIRSSSADFSDATARITHRLGDNGTISLSGFWSYDYFRYARDFGYSWRNRLLSAGWRQRLTDRLFSNLSVIAGDYISQQFDPEGNDAFRLHGGMRQFKVREWLSFSSSSNDHKLLAGLDWHYQEGLPERLEPGSAISTVAPLQVAKDRGHEWAAFLSDEWTITPALSASIGFRYSLFQAEGPREVFVYADGQPREPESVIDTLDFASGRPLARYGGPEPRLSLRYRLSPQQSIKAAYNRLRQYVHLISNTAAATPSDIWQLSNRHIPPQVADNFSLGYFRNDKRNKWELSLESFYREVRNMVEFQDLPDLLLNEHLETELLNARGRAYGLEWSLRKNTGKWNGWLAYTYTRTLVQAASTYPREQVNNGRWYPAAFDQPHQITVVSRWQWTPRQSLTLNFIYRSGRPVTGPEGGYLQGDVYVPHYSPRHAYRIGDYHRLDISYTIDNSEKRSKGLRGSLTFAVYNLYFRQNPFSVYFIPGTDGVPRAFRLAILGTAFPSVNYNFIF